MKRYEETIKLCKNIFANHKATLLQDTDQFAIIDWRNVNGSGDYFIRYIIDKQRGSLIVSGDLGNSIATWYNELTVKKIKNFIHTDTGYYISKFQCTSDRYYQDEDDIFNEIKKYTENYKDSELLDIYNAASSCIEDLDEIDEMWEDIRSEISNGAEYENFMPSKELQAFCQEIGLEYHDLCTCGRHICPRVFMWAEGLYMACEQLNI